eukprot:TRINITY_DN7519_c0_g1_i2.p1 TRINITY_DN7519_c0_g1~~TRINITY_DN7519_c0_g1_i2.p1  ORF type:complete len:716 (-),score=133.13 TRINITY_DN7519_c0_g1_i2:21-2168(-)
MNQWLDHIQSILYGVATTVHYIADQKKTVMVHCSDGWDRTPQLTGTSMLCVDPYYRTMEGFQVLIEKEWCSFGHKFSQRAGHELMLSDGSSQEKSPVFIQWMDVVYQLTKQFPQAFEFNHRLLLTLIDAVHDCKFGTFLFDTPKERQEYKLMTTTTSVWSYINDESVKHKFINPCYEPSRYKKVLKVSPHRDDIHFWRGFYYRWFRPVGDADGYDILEKKYIDLQREVEELRRRLGEDKYISGESSEDEIEADMDRFINSKSRSRKPLKSAVSATTTTMKKLNPLHHNRKRFESVDWRVIDSQQQQPQRATLEEDSSGSEEATPPPSSSSIPPPSFNGGDGVEAEETELEQIARNKLLQMKASLLQQQQVLLTQLNNPALSAQEVKHLQAKVTHLSEQEEQIQTMMQNLSPSNSARASQLSPRNRQRDTMKPSALPARPSGNAPGSKGITTSSSRIELRATVNSSPPPVPIRGLNQSTERANIGIRPRKMESVDSGTTGMGRSGGDTRMGLSPRHAPSAPASVSTGRNPWRQQDQDCSNSNSASPVSPVNKIANPQPSRSFSSPNFSHGVTPSHSSAPFSYTQTPSPASQNNYTQNPSPAPQNNYSTLPPVPQNSQMMPEKARDVLTSILKTASTLLTIPNETAYIGDRHRVRLLQATREIESYVDKSKNIQLLTQLLQVVGAFVDATKQSDPDILDEAFSRLVDLIQTMLENCE